MIGKETAVTRFLQPIRVMFSRRITGQWLSPQMCIRDRIVVMVNDYKPIEVKDLPQAVQDTIKKDFEMCIRDSLNRHTNSFKCWGNPGTY